MIKSLDMIKASQIYHFDWIFPPSPTLIGPAGLACFLNRDGRTWNLSLLELRKSFKRYLDLKNNSKWFNLLRNNIGSKPWTFSLIFCKIGILWHELHLIYNRLTLGLQLYYKTGTIRDYNTKPLNIIFYFMKLTRYFSSIACMPF